MLVGNDEPTGCISREASFPTVYGFVHVSWPFPLPSEEGAASPFHRIMVSKCQMQVQPKCKCNAPCLQVRRTHDLHKPLRSPTL